MSEQVKSNDPLELVAYVLHLEIWRDDDEDIVSFTDESLQRYGEKWRKEFIPQRYSDHCGDCTDVPCSCLRCYMDNLFGHAERILRSRDEQNEIPSSHKTDQPEPSA